ncbi:Dipeptidyl peptidase [Fasciola hepatica]|uniref:dipeptidyl-peptidase III n=1 Tax=Fasciola hepatica TaxID=6192 RepID=A0A4E0RVQ0_FASHE|nr:Dipeptidyl peptidase [Fasciola hepatica]
MDFYVNVPPPVYYLDSTQAFNALENTEKKYIYACSQASWIGGLIDLIQTSPESAGIFLMVQKIFQSQKPAEIAELAKNSGFTDDEVTAALSYFACVCGNLGNYQNFGDTKFIPAISQTRLTQLLSLTHAFNDSKNSAKRLFDELSPAIYSLNPRRLRLGFGPQDGITTYYSANCTREDAEIAQDYLKATNMEAYNTRLFKENSSKNNQHLVSLRIASAEMKIVPGQPVGKLPSDWSFQLQYGDLSELMSVLVQSTKLVVPVVLNDNQRKMWALYSESFRTGNIDLHKEASKVWVKDISPAVETYIGFIESYRDPLGVRAEFESFVAIVNKVISAKFQNLVDSAVQIISHLPWPSTYERDVFRKPDFTSLDVVTFATSGIPIGINIPNYDDIRESDGFKNVSLGNVLAARFKDPKAEFLSEADKLIYLPNIETAFEIQVGLHELLGHGSGKLFRRNLDGTFNFDREKTKDLLTGGPIESWYEPGENWDNKFASLSSSIEECRAECVGVYLCDLPEVLQFFDPESARKPANVVPDVVFVNWLSMIRSGVMSMEFYSPPENSGDVGAWRQAHCCARYAILRVSLYVDCLSLFDVFLFLCAPKRVSSKINLDL